MESHVDGPLAVVSVAAGVRAEDDGRHNAKTRLLEDLPPDSLGRALPRLDEAPRELPTTSIRLLATLQHQVTSVAFDECERGDRGVVVVHEMTPPAPHPSTVRSVREREQLIAAEGAETKLHGSR